MADMKYAVVFERGETSFGAHVPDLPGCIAAGESREDPLRLIRAAIEIHLRIMRKEYTAAPEVVIPKEVKGALATGQMAA